MFPGPLHPQWNNLIQWLKSHGMSLDELSVQARLRQGAGYGLYATRPILSDTPLFTIPASALPNVLTLGSYYPGSDHALTAVQLISLHLVLHQSSSDPIFGPYISVLPRDFIFHPLTWLHKRNHGVLSRDCEERLLDALPLSVVKKLKDASAKFETDWKRVSDYLQDNPSLYDRFRRDSLNDVEHETRFLWAWLNVNTRCVYYRVRASPTDPDNISLCPLLDFANHTASGPHMKPTSGKGAPRPRPLKAGDIMLMSPADLNIEEDQEMYLIYGSHSNKRLFVEYGFIVRFSAEALCSGRFFGEVDVQDLVENLFQQRGEIGEWMKGILVKEGYWGDWTMQSAPAPAHPSFRLITALRLYHACEATAIGESSEDDVHPWFETIRGVREHISKDNEERWRGTLVEICEKVEAEAKRGLLEIQPEISREWAKDMQENITQLWEEELWVARSVKTSIERGIAF